MSGHSRRLARLGSLCIVTAITIAAYGDSVATELRVSWDRCGPASVSHRDFACATNTGTDTLSISLVPDFNFPQLARASIAVGICFNEHIYPDWWHVLRPGDCRLGSLIALPVAPTGGCASAWDPDGGSSVHIIAGPSKTILNGTAFRLDVLVGDSTRARDLVAGEEYELARLVIDHAGTVGNGACVGCEIGADIVGEYVWLYTTDGRGSGSGVRARPATWQDPQMICSTVSPVRQTTWGRLKSVYR